MCLHFIRFKHRRGECPGDEVGISKVSPDSRTLVNRLASRGYKCSVDGQLEVDKGKLKLEIAGEISTFQTLYSSEFTFIKFGN